MKQGGIKHIRSAPYHPSTNGLAERFVQTFKKALKASENDGQSLKAQIARFLANYRSTPHATTRVTPSELFLQRKVRTKFVMLKPDTQSVVDVKQSIQQQYHDNCGKLRNFTPGQTVIARDYLSSKKWVRGVLESSSGPIMYRVKLVNGKVVVRHVDQLHAQLPVDVLQTQQDLFLAEKKVLDFETRPEQHCFLPCNYFSVWSSRRRAMPLQESQSVSQLGE